MTSEFFSTEPVFRKIWNYFNSPSTTKISWTLYALLNFWGRKPPVKLKNMKTINIDV